MSAYLTAAAKAEQPERVVFDSETTKLLRIGDVMSRVGLSRSAINRLENAGNFPSRRKIGKSRVVWLQREIEAWIDSLPKAGAHG